MGTVDSYVGSGGLTVDNATWAGHLLFEGQINRNAIQIDGSWYSITHGWGTNVYFNPITTLSNQYLGPVQFRALDDQIKTELYGATHH